MKCGCNETLKIPYGNPFRLCICRDNVAPGNPDGITFADIDDLQVSLTRMVGDVAVEHEVLGNGDLMITGEPTLECSAYGIMMTGTYQGNPWRWRTRRVFTIVMYNADSSEEGRETFGVETYYISDVLFVETEDDTAYFITHGHAGFKDGALFLQETADTSVSLDSENGILTIIQPDKTWQQ